MSVYGTSPLKRQRRTKTAIDDIQAAIYAVCESDHPQTVRGVFYRLEVLGMVPKDLAGYGVVQRECLKMRRAGTLPYEWISDGTRLQRVPAAYDGLSDFLFRTAQLYRRNLWADANATIEIWCEKDALSGVLFEETSVWGVPLMSARGFASESFLWSTAEAIRKDDKPAHIYHVGDHDPSGRIIDRQIERGLRRLAPNAEIHFTRLAVTERQIVDWNLPTRPTKREHNTHAKGFKGDSVEADAIPARQLRQLVRDAISQHVDPANLQRVQAAEESEHAILSRMAQREIRRDFPDTADDLVDILETRQAEVRQRWA